MWSDNTKPKLKGKKGNEVVEDTSNECVQQISQKNASIQSTMLLLTLRRHALVVSIQLSLSKAPQSNLITLWKTWPYSSVLSLLFSSLLLKEKRRLMRWVMTTKTCSSSKNGTKGGRGGGEKCFFVKKAYWGDEGFHVLEIVMGLY
jgi:hypothetical protein